MVRLSPLWFIPSDFNDVPYKILKERSTIELNGKIASTMKSVNFSLYVVKKFPVLAEK